MEALTLPVPLSLVPFKEFPFSRAASISMHETAEPQGKILNTLILLSSND